jgi:hypothetical protein
MHFLPKTLVYGAEGENGKQHFAFGITGERGMRESKTEVI